MNVSNIEYNTIALGNLVFLTFFIKNVEIITFNNFSNLIDRKKCVKVTNLDNFIKVNNDKVLDVGCQSSPTFFS